MIFPVRITYQDGVVERHDEIDDIHENLAEAAAGGILPTEIVDGGSNHYYVEWDPGLVRCHVAAKQS